MTIIGTHCHINIYGLILTLSKYLFVLFMHLNVFILRPSRWPHCWPKRKPFCM